MDEITAGMLNGSITDVGGIVELGDFRHDYFEDFAALYANIFTLVLPRDMIIPFMHLSTQILPEKSTADWVMEFYLPEIMAATENNSIPVMERLDILTKVAGVLTKIGYSFVWEEDFLNIPGVDFTSPTTLWFGASMIPYVLMWADMLTGFK